MVNFGKRGGSVALTLILIAVVLLSVFTIQIALQGVESFLPVPEGGDVAVIGGTSAALLAAHYAAERGAIVYLFPQDQELACDAFFLAEGGLAAAQTPLQQERGIDFSTEDLRMFLRDHGGGLNDPFLLQHFAGEAGELYARAEKEIGISFDLLPFPEEKPYLHLNTSFALGLNMKRSLLEKLKESLVFIRSEKVQEIILSPAGQVEALLLEKENKDQFHFYVQAVILADGGYSNDLSAWKDYLPQHHLITIRPEQKGEGIKLATRLGAQIIQASFIHKVILLFAPWSGEYHIIDNKLWENSFLLNLQGQVLPLKEASPDEMVSFVINSPPGEVLLLAPEEEALNAAAFFRRLDSLEQLLEKYTLSELPVFSGRMIPAPPLYVAHVRAAVDYTLGGLAVTPAGEVKRETGIIKGLYAAGEITGGLHGEALLPGMPLSETLIFSRIAAEAAAAYAQR